MLSKYLLLDLSFLGKVKWELREIHHVGCRGDPDTAPKIASLKTNKKQMVEKFLWHSTIVRADVGNGWLNESGSAAQKYVY